MPLTTAGLDAAVDGIAAVNTRTSLHIADPSSPDADEVVATGYSDTTWAAAFNGSRAESQVSAALPGSTTVEHGGVFSADSDGTPACGSPLGAAETAGSAGTVQHASTITVTH
ncbi:hypothetical protein SAMN05660690_4557 [Geodermatophilus telluris]|uniref:Uncharacterized protein n=1 Tax=Geodermatophilus telluris TaxID=1190417 RepID=A0A1G6VST7_9ACTN|nr:hypothetical protein [Geodermatophilus telluris]SDD56047.1 hypothetical protein SAMN05660690_4557 [Geodermatophilus telluris]